MTCSQDPLKMWSSGILDLDYHFFLCWYSWAPITAFQEMGHSQKFSRRVVWTPQNQGNITHLNHSIPNPICIPINYPLWCKLLIVSIYWLHLSWKIWNEYSTESTSLRKQAEKRQEMQGSAYTAICTRMNLKY